MERRELQPRLVKRIQEIDCDFADNKPAPKGTTTAHVVKFMNGLLDELDCDEAFNGNYIVIDNVSIRESKPMLRKIESRGYKVMYLPPYLLELNPITTILGNS